MKSDMEVNKMDEFTYNKERFEAEYWLYDCPSADELMLWVSQKAIAGYKNYVTHGDMDEYEITDYEIELILNENFRPVHFFVINNLNSNAEAEFFEEITSFLRFVSTSTYMSDFPSKRTIRLMFWFMPDCYDHQ